MALPRLGLSPSLGVHMEHKDRQGNAAALNHPGEVSFQISGCEVVRTAVEQPCDATHGPGVTDDRLVSHALQREGLQVLGIELVETLLLVLFHGEVSHQRDERNDTHMRVCILHCGTARLQTDRTSSSSPCKPALISSALEHSA